MSLYQRAATLAAIVIGIASMIGTSAPGYALVLDRPVNLSSVLLVPPLPKISTTDADPVAIGEQAGPAVAASVRFESLAEAVAAQDPPAALEDELACLAGAVYFEAKGEPLAGQLAVAQVILNRTRSGRFPASVCSVVTQPGQFSFVRGGRVPAVAGNAAYRTALAVAQVALARGWNDPAPSALFFHARRVAPSWRMTRIAAIGNHVFYR